MTTPQKWTEPLNLLPRYREELEALLRQHVPEAEVWAYGSRVNGQCHAGSNLELALRSPALGPLGCEYLELVEARSSPASPSWCRPTTGRDCRRVSTGRLSAAML